MTLIVRLIAKYALWIYILCGLAMLLYLRAALSARNEGSQAIFSLERESAAKRVYRSSGMIVVLLLIVIGVYALSNYVELPPTSARATQPPNPDETATAEAGVTGTPAAGSVTPGADGGDAPFAGVGTEMPQPTATRRSQITVVVPPTLEQSAPTAQVVAAACPHANVQIDQPGLNQVIDGGIQVVGTATKEGFNRYEFKFQSQDVPGDDWHWVETFRAPVQNGNLGFWSTAHLPPGRYRFMLIAIDKTGNSQECIVPVRIQH